jgi:hypothetical protein
MPYPKGFDPEFFMRELDKRPDLAGCRVVYYEDAIMSTLRPGPPLSREDLVAVVVRKGGKELIPTSAEIQKARDARFHAELLNLGISCGGALLAWVGTIVSTGAAPVTGGLSLIITATTTAATVAGYLQCGVAVARVGTTLYDPSLTVDVDNSDWYPVFSNIMDAVGLIGVAGTTAQVSKAVLLMKGATGKPFLEILKGLSRQEKKRLTEEILRSTNPGLSNAKMKLLQLAKKAPVRYPPKAISDGVRKQLMDSIGAVGNVTGSATGGLIKSAMSDSNEEYIVGLVSAYETQ